MAARSPRTSRSARWILIGCCLGTVTLTSACSSSEATRADDTVEVDRHGVAAVEPAERPPTPTTTPAPRAEAVTQLIGDALRRAGNVRRAELLRRLGPPRRTTAEAVHNRYALGRVDTVRTFLYPGLEATLYEATQPPRTFLIRLTLTSARYRSPEGLHVGMHPTQVIARIGPPTEQGATAGELVYAEHESMPTALILTVEDGRVTQIAWEFYFS